MNDDIEDIQEEEARELLQNAAAASARIISKRSIQPLSTNQTASPQQEDEGVSWSSIMPAVPGTTVKPEIGAKEKEIADMKASAIRKPGYDNKIQATVGDFPPPPPLGGMVTDGNQLIGGTGANSGQAQSASDAAKDSNPGLQGPR